MRRRNLGNKAVIKAITIGLSAVMATAQPMVVLAADGDAPTDGGQSSSETIAPVDIAGGVADTAQQAAKDASDAIGVNDPAVKTDDTAASKACDDAADTILADFNAGEAKALSTAAAPSNEKGVKDAAQALADDTTLEAAAGFVEEANTELIKAEDAVVDSNAAALDVVDNAVAAVDMADSADATVDAALQRADELINDINNASDETAAMQAYAGVQQLVTDTTKDFNLKKQAFDSYFSQYTTAKQDLIAAEGRYNNAMKASSQDAAKAKERVVEAKAKVDALETQVNTALNDVKEQNKAALTILEKLETVNKDNSADWTHQRDLFMAILENYPGMIEDDATGIKITSHNDKKTTVHGEFGKYHYFEVKYKVNGEDRVKYFNYDRADKDEVLEDGTSKNIIIYEKTQEEIDATNYLKQYLTAHNESIPDNNSVKKDPGLVDGYKVFTYKDENGDTKYILKKELANNPLYASTTENGKTVYYALNGNGTTADKIVEVAAPSDDDLKALAINASTSSLDIDEDSESVSYYLDKDGELVKEVKGDYVVTTYTREVTETGTDYTKERPSNVLSEDEKNALITKVQADLALSLPEGQSVTLKFAEVKDAESNDTYYKLTGSYVPLFKVQINDKDIDEFADDNDGSSLNPYWVNDNSVPIVHGYFTAPILTNHTSEKEANGLNTFLQRIKDAGYTVTTNNLQKKMYDDGWNYGCEEIYVWGNIEYTKDGVAARTGIESGEYTSLEAALEGLNTAIQNNLATDGVNGDLTVRTIDHLGEAKTVKVLGVNIPYWYDPYDVVRTDKTFTATESYTNVDYTTDSYKKYAPYIEYVKAVVDAAQEGQVLSETTYANAERMLEVMINKNNKYNGGTGYLDVKNDEDFNKFLQDAKDLLGQYQGYQTKVTEAQNAVGEAETKVVTLQTAIDEIENGKVADQRITLRAALTELEIPESKWAAFLGITVADEETADNNAIIADLVMEETEIKSLLDKPVRDALDDLDKILGRSQKKLELAEINLKSLNDKLDQAGDDLEEAIERLTPDETTDDDFTPSDDGDTDDGDDGAVLPPSGTPGPGTPVFTPAYSGGTVTGGAGVAATNIADGATPLAGSVQTNNKTADDVINVTDTKDIKDSKTPLANIPADQQEAAANFWWLVLAAIAAVTGVGSYKYYQNNKKAEVAEAKKED